MYVRAILRGDLPGDFRFLRLAAIHPRFLSVRELQRRQFAVAPDWVVRELDLPGPY
jgi:hypothetical protein